MKKKRSIFVSWFLFLFVLGLVNFVLPYATIFSSHADDCFATSKTATFGYTSTGRPCASPKIVNTLPLQNSTPSKLSETLFLSTLPLYIFALVAVVGTVSVWAFVRD